MTLLRAILLATFLSVFANQTVIAQSSSTPSTTLDEIIVTAQKRAEDINDVPIAISAFDNEALARFDVTKPEDIKFLVPGLDIYNNVEAGGLSVALRGMSIFTFTPTSDPAVAMYLDEAYLASLSQLAFQTFDMEAVEVLKGPQGTLFGRNTPGGLIHFRTKRPTDEFSAYVRAEAGDYGSFAAETVLNGPLSDSVSGRLSVRGSLFDGYFENRLQGRDSTGGVDSISTRGQLLFEPSEDASILLSLHYDRFNGTSTPFFSRGLIDPAGGLCSSFLPLVANGGGDGEAFNDAFEQATALGCTDFDGFNEPDTDPFTVSVDSTFGPDGVREGTAFGMRLIADFALNESTALTSVTSYEYDDQFWEAIQFSPLAGAADLPQQSDVGAFSQELRLAGGDDQKQWVLGGFLSYDDITFDIVDSLVFFLPYSLFGDQNTTSIALFGNVDWQLNDAWTFTLGLRGTHEEREVSIDVLSVPGLIGSDGFSFVNKVDTTNISGKLGLSFRPTDDVLMYGNLSTGFKSPGFNTAFVTSDIEVGPTREEKITAFELGLKATLLEGRMQTNLAAYYYDRQDAQGVDFVANIGGIPVQGLTNFGDADLYGFEADIQWKPAANLELAAGISLLETEVTNGTYDGNNLTSAPNVTATLMGRYSFQVGDNWTLSPQVDARYIGERNRFISNALPISEIDGVPVNGRITDEQFAYWQINAGVELFSNDGNWLLSAKAFNLLDEVELQSYFFFNEFTTLAVGEPRTFKVSITRHWN